MSRRYGAAVLACAGVAFVGALGACGGGAPPARRPKAEGDEPAPRASRPPLAMSAEIGALDERAVEKGFERAMPALRRCFEQGTARVELLGGEVAFFLRIDGGGRLAHTHLERSSLGDRATERCMLEALGRQSWPAPVGGENGIARKSFAFDPSGDVREPVEWEADRVAPVVEGLSGELQECKRGATGEFVVTLYVGTEGRALGVGVAPPDEAGEAASDCIAAALGKAKYPSPGSWPAKVSVGL